MKKFLTYLFAGLLFVPTFAGCGGGGGEAGVVEEDDSKAIEGMDEDAYGDMMNKANQPPQ